jgi:hypothetical protein
MAHHSKAFAADLANVLPDSNFVADRKKPILALDAGICQLAGRWSKRAGGVFAKIAAVR